MALTREATFEVLNVSRDRHGGGPWWSTAEQRLYWVDSTGCCVRSCDLDAQHLRQWLTPSTVGFVVPDADGQMICGLRHCLGRLNPRTGQVDRGPLIDERDDHRLSDGKTDRNGQLWFGSMHLPETTRTSFFYHVGGAGLEMIFEGVICSAGVAWSPDSSVMYYADSKSHQIWAFDFNADTDMVTNPRVFVQDPGARCASAGLTVDAEGCVWSAKSPGSRLVRYAPDGATLITYVLPVSCLTSCMFVGQRLDRLAVTSARLETGAEPLAGSVFLVDPGTTGLAETPVRRDQWAQSMAGHCVPVAASRPRHYLRRVESSR